MFTPSHTAEVVSTSTDGRRATTVSASVDANPALPDYYQDDPATNAAVENPDFSYDLGDTSWIPGAFEPEPDGITLIRSKRYENSVHINSYTTTHWLTGLIRISP
jgi:hypothetical protein